MAKKMKLRVSGRLLRKRARRSDSRMVKGCRFTSGEVPVSAIDYKNSQFLRTFLTERGKLVGARVSGHKAKYQRLVVREIKKARSMALLPYLALERRVPVERDRAEWGDRNSDRAPRDRGDRGDRGERGNRESRFTSSAPQE